MSRREAGLVVTLVYTFATLAAWRLFAHVEWTLGIDDARDVQVTRAFGFVMAACLLVSWFRLARRPAAPRNEPVPTRGADLRARWTGALRRATAHPEVLFAYGTIVGLALSAVIILVTTLFYPLTAPMALFLALPLTLTTAHSCNRIWSLLYRADEPPSEEELFAGANDAVREAIARLHRANIPTTHMIGGRLVQIHPDGRREELRSTS